MNIPGMKLLSIQEMAASQFVSNKGRLPDHMRELVQWLLEFQKADGILLERMEQAMHEQAMFCTCGVYRATPEEPKR